MNQANKVEKFQLQLLKNQNLKLHENINCIKGQIGESICSMKNRVLACQVFRSEMNKEREESLERLSLVKKLYNLTKEIQDQENATNRIS